jgi:hypothetical protein
VSMVGSDWVKHPYDSLIETWEGVNLYADADTPVYYFTYKGLFYDGFTSQQLAEAAIDALIIGMVEPVNLGAFAPPSSETRTPYNIYKGVNYYHIDQVLSDGTLFSVYYFYYNGSLVGMIGEEAETLRAIDARLTYVIPPEPTTPPTTPTGTPYTPPTPPVTTSTPAPTGDTWIGGIIDQIIGWFDYWVKLAKAPLDAINTGIGGLSSMLTGSLSALGSAVNGIGSAIGGVGQGVSDAILGGLKATGNSLSQPLQDATKTALDEALKSTSAHSPDPVVKAKLQELIKQLQTNQTAIIDSIKHSQISPEGSQDAANTLTVELIGAQLAIKTSALLIDLLHPIKNIEALEVIGPMVDSVLSGASVNELMSMHIRASIIPALQKHVNSLYTPQIPGYGDLINMLVKEKITREDFESNFSYMGYNKEWASKIWDAHFNAPSLTDILTSWRRGEITEQRVDELMILVDLDPAYKPVFDTRKYVDPSLSLARYMFETGSIDVSRVADIVKRSGFREADASNITDWIIKNQERRYRQRYLTTLAAGYARGVVDKAELSTSVLEAGYTQGTADWIVKSADIRKEIAGRTGVSSGPKLLALGDLKKAYANSLYTEDQLRTELQVRGYQTGDIETLIEVLNLDKADVDRGKRVVALSVSEMVNAFRYGVWTEDHLRIELQLRGLSTDEVNTLIDTKKAQWGVAAQQGP